MPKDWHGHEPGFHKRERKSYTCRHCKTRFASKPALNKHLWESHKENY
jgi:hypothetical protein